MKQGRTDAPVYSAMDGRINETQVHGVWTDKGKLSSAHTIKIQAIWDWERATQLKRLYIAHQNQVDDLKKSKERGFHMGGGTVIQ